MIPEELAAQYRALYAEARNEYDRACVETQLMTELRRSPTRNGEADSDFRTRVAQLLGIPIFVVESHRALTMGGDLSTPLWPRLDKEMPLARAVSLMRKARTTRIEGESGAAAIARVLAHYDSLPYQRYISGNKWYRSETPGTKPRRPHAAKPPPEKAPRRPSEPTVAPKPASQRQPESSPPEVPAPERSEDFFTQIHSLVLRQVQTQLGSSCSDLDIATEAATLETDLKVLLFQFCARLNDKKRRAGEPMSLVLTRRQITEACRILKLDPPKGQLVRGSEFFTRAQRQFKLLAREYHPDTQGSDVTKDLFDAVTTAWRTIQQFRDSLE